MLSGSRRRKPRTRHSLSGNKKRTKKETMRIYREQSSMNRITDPQIIEAQNYLARIESEGKYFTDKKGRKLTYYKSLMAALDFI
jgi:hypothetical protein